MDEVLCLQIRGPKLRIDTQLEFQAFTFHQRLGFGATRHQNVPAPSDVAKACPINKIWGQGCREIASALTLLVLVSFGARMSSPS